MTKDKANMQEWSERLEAGERDDDLLAIVARMEKTRDETPAPSMEFRRQLRRDLLNQYETTAQSPGRFRRLAGSLVGVGLLAALVVATWLTMGSAGRASFGGAPSDGVPRVSTPPVTAAVVTAYSENIPEGLTPGGTLDVRVRWLIPDVLAGGRPFAELRNDSGQTVAQADGQLHASGEEQAVDFLIPLPNELPDGRYTMVVGLYDGDGARIPIYDSISSAVIFEYAIESATVGEGEPASAGIGPAATAPPPDGSRYTLLDYTVRGGVVTETMQTDGGEEQTQSLLVPGIDIEVVTHWSLPSDTGEATAFVHLLAGDESIIAQGDAPIQAAPATGGRRAKASVILSVPADLAPGAYQLVGGLHDPATGAQLPFNKAADEVSRYLIGGYIVSAGSATALGQSNEFVIELPSGDEIPIQLSGQDESQTIGWDSLVIREVTPESGTLLTGDDSLDFLITLDYTLSTLPEAVVDLRISTFEENDPSAGRGVGGATTAISRGQGTIEVKISVSRSEFNGPSYLGIWLQLKPDDDPRSPPILIVEMPGMKWHWRYEP